MNCIGSVSDDKDQDTTFKHIVRMARYIPGSASALINIQYQYKGVLILILNAPLVLILY